MQKSAPVRVQVKARCVRMQGASDHICLCYRLSAIPLTYTASGQHAKGRGCTGSDRLPGGSHHFVRAFILSYLILSYLILSLGASMAGFAAQS